MKSWYSTVFIAIIVCIIVDEVKSDEVFEGKCGENVNFTLADGVLTINGTGKMNDFFTSIPPPWKEKKDLIKSIVIKNGVTSIGDYAFSECKALENVSIPDTVTYIGSHSFVYCESLKNITIPDSVTSLGYYVFAFCKDLTKVTLGNGITSIKDYLFYCCEDLVSVNIPEAVTSIGEAAFGRCYNLKNVDLPPNLKSIGEEAFEYCYNFTSLTIPATVESIGPGAFCYCDNLTHVELEAGSKKLFMDDNVLYDYNHTILLYYFPAEKESYTILDGVKTIAKSAFFRSNLTNVVIPNSVTKIGHSAFFGCSKLNNFIIPDNCKTIEDSAFMLCESLTEMILPYGLTTIPTGLFEGCKSLKSVFIPDTVVSIGYFAFRSCSNLTSFIIPPSVTSIQDGVFDFCPSLTTITIPDGFTYIYGLFYQSPNIETVFYQGSHDISGSPLPTLKTLCVGPNYTGETFLGQPVTNDNETCIKYRGLFTRCYAPAYADGGFVMKKMYKTSFWENQTGVCGVYRCFNETGLFSWSLCNSSGDESLLCMDNKCINNWEKHVGGWLVYIEFDDLKFKEMSIPAVASDIKKLTETSVDLNKIGIESDDKGNVKLIVVRFSYESTANSVADSVNNLNKGQDCNYDVLCRAKIATVHEGKEYDFSSSNKKSENSFADVSRSSSIHHISVNVIIALFIGMVFALL